MNDSDFKDALNSLNKAQIDAVDSIEGPVMVVAGPGTGKTQVLALRIANILTKTQIKADGILCLTFTNSGVKAMRERLYKYIHKEASNVEVATFHSFGMKIIEKYFQDLGLLEIPKIMNETDMVSLYDSILENNDFKYLKSRSDNTKYFRDLKSLISFLKRERINSTDFEFKIKEEIKRLEKDPASLSSRGATKGELKKEIQNKIESLNKTLESARFLEIYEDIKKEQNLFDYDDVLINLVKIVEESEEAPFFIKEQYQYILIDEHQDSSGIQNEFLKKVWGNEEKPNIFVVGDDRQLIYGFGGASLDYFKNFENKFGKAKKITLVENYRSTQTILDTAHKIIESSISKERLVSKSGVGEPVRLIEANYPREEIIFCGLEIKEKIKNGEDGDQMAILVPKNKHVRSAITILKDMGLSVASGEKINFFDTKEAFFMMNVLKIIAEPTNTPLVSASFFDKLSGISPLEAHRFAIENKMNNFSILNYKNPSSLFSDQNQIENWLNKLKSWIEKSNEGDIYSFIQEVGTEFLLENVSTHEELVLRVEVLRTLLHLALYQIEKNPNATLLEFVNFLERLNAYGEHIPLSVFSAENGVRVLTMHGSKGLEFDYVWIANMDQKSFEGSMNSSFALPESLEEKVEKKNDLVLRRELYVAMTRARKSCAISYSKHSYSGNDLEVASIVAELEESLSKIDSDTVEKTILENSPTNYVSKVKKENHVFSMIDLQKLVAKDYTDRKVSVSLLNNFFECPWKWYFRNLLQLPEAKSKSLEFGNLIHSAIDKILKLDTTPNKNEISLMVNKDKEAISIVSNWVLNRLPKISENRKNEESISFKDERFPHLSIYGKVDLIEILNEKDVSVTDFKTGKARTKSDVEKLNEEGRMSDYLRQLSMYSYLLNNSKWNKNVNLSTLEFVESTNSKEMFYQTMITEKEIDLLIRDINDYDELVKEGKWTERKCNFKPYGKQNSVCEYCKLSSIYKQ